MTSEVDIDHVRILHVLARYCHHCDDGHFDDLAHLFTEDGTFAYGGKETTGRADLVSYFELVQTPERRGKHLTTNSFVQIDESGERAEVASDFLFLAYQDGVLAPRIAGRYRDRLAKVDGRWLLDRRDVEPYLPPA